MAKDWTSVRVTRKTADRLNEIRRSYLSEYLRGARQLPESECDGVSLDYVLGTLLDLIEGHRERARRQRDRKAAKASAPPADPEAK
jgi:hypothetical protein